MTTTMTIIRPGVEVEYRDERPIAFSWKLRDNYHSFVGLRGLSSWNIEFHVGAYYKIFIEKVSDQKSLDYILGYCEGWFKHRLTAMEISDRATVHRPAHFD